MSSFQYIMVPVCTTTARHVTRADEGRHWFLLVADVNNRLVWSLDSLQRPSADAHSYLELFRFVNDEYLVCW